MTRLLVIDAYSDAGRESLAAAGCTHAGVLYERMLFRLDSTLELDLIVASKASPELPEGASLSDYDGVVWTGSNLSAHKDTPAVRGQAALVRAHLEAGVPGFGSCWAAQLSVVAAGGAVAPNPKGREFGVARKIALTEAGRAHPLYVGKSRVFDGFTSHEDEITQLPPGASVLAGNAFTRVQAVHVRHGSSRKGLVLGAAIPPGVQPRGRGPPRRRPGAPAHRAGLLRRGRGPRLLRRGLGAARGPSRGARIWPFGWASTTTCWTRRSARSRSATGWRRLRSS